MATIEIYAKLCAFERGFMSYDLLAPKLESRSIETGKLADVAAEIEAMHERLKADDPARPFFVTSLVRKGRAPNGYANARDRLDYKP